MTKGFGPLLPGFVHLEFGDHDALTAAISDKTCAVMVEPVQGEGGIHRNAQVFSGNIFFGAFKLL